jgi:C-terminal processing protease CtpA/Prc
MLSAALFGVQGKYYLFLPVANYYTPDGITLDQVGVEPTIKLDASQALDYVVGSLAD